MRRRSRSIAAFTLLELLAVIAIIGLLVGMFVPSLFRAKSLAGEKICASNLRQINLALLMYANDGNDGIYPLELTEHNPHPDLMKKLGRNISRVNEVLYCPQASYMETFANNPAYKPKGATDSVIDTPENRQAGNISYVYWSFLENKAYGSEAWRNPAYFIPRQLTVEGIEELSPDRSSLEAPVSRRWVVSDFFRRGAPFPHAREHARGLNIGYLDGHVDLIFGRPRDNYR